MHFLPVHMEYVFLAKLGSVGGKDRYLWEEFLKGGVWRMRGVHRDGKPGAGGRIKLSDLPPNLLPM